MTYCVDVITADASKLKNRGLAYAFTSSPYIITAFAGAKAAEGFYYDISWRWGFGCFAIIFPIVAAPLFGIIKANMNKAKKVGTYVPHNSGRNVFQSIWHYTVDFDRKLNVLACQGLEKQWTADRWVHEQSLECWYSLSASCSSYCRSTSPIPRLMDGLPATSSPCWSSGSSCS